jgi:hypothetical protein
VVGVGLEFLDLHRAGVHVQHLRMMMIYPHHGVQFRHEVTPDSSIVPGIIAAIGALQIE